MPRVIETRPPHSSPSDFARMQEERAEKFLRLTAILETAELETRALTDVEGLEFSELDARVTSLDALCSDWHHMRGIFARK